MPDTAARLYLISPPLADADGFARPLEAALGAGDVACVLFRGAASDDVLTPLIRMVQAQGGAALVADDASLASRLDADGVHVHGIGSLPEAIRRLKPARIVGAGDLSARDDAMVAGELGADYVMLGDAADPAEPFADRLDRVAWWAEIFQVPCVAMAPHLDEVAPLVEAGAEFVGVSSLVWDDPRGPATAVAEITAAIAKGHADFLARHSEAVE